MYRKRWGGGSFKSHKLYEKIISPENLFSAWGEFRVGKLRRADVAAYDVQLEDNIFRLHDSLKSGRYQHGPYESFIICDPKRRHIHKPGVSDRLLHHAVVRLIEPLFDRGFIFDSWSCRDNKGTHAAVVRFQQLAQEISANNHNIVWVLQLDIRKFFDSIDHDVLLQLLRRKISDPKVMSLLAEIIGSFSPGLPLGNLTSQLCANIYMNPLDQFVKHDLKIRGYLRYADDFTLLHTNRRVLEACIPRIAAMLWSQLKLRIHPEKITIKKFRSGIDLLGYICFPNFRIIRTRMKRRIMRRVEPKNLASYMGALSHCRSYGFKHILLSHIRSGWQNKKLPIR